MNAMMDIDNNNNDDDKDKSFEFWKEKKEEKNLNRNFVDFVKPKIKGVRCMVWWMDIEVSTLFV